MKQSAILYLLFLMLGLYPSSAQSADVEPGVSKALAEERAATIGDVRYELSFHVPASKAEPVSGSATITFMLRGSDDVQLDFQGEPQQFDGHCQVNGEEATAVFRNEHIIIGRDLLRPNEVNTISLRFTSGDKALNRSDDYLYTLFVPDHARSVFPCFDQPDLKARFSVTLELPDGWTSISNQTEQPIPTYLFSFTAGRFKVQKATRDGRELTALYRETDPAKVAQLGTVFDQVALSLRWMEQYTGIPYPFEQYGFVVLPGYQFGGMEHPGCIQFTDHEIFLPQNPTPDEELTRLNLIAHETAHMWFGDLVTMRWFDDVWTKEVFANFMADKISRQQFPDINHDLVFLRNHYPSALATDRTEGTHPIQQPLQNLNGAGLLYGNIIYHKAPIMMRKLEERMGEEALQRGLQNYLKTFSYGNATWDDLIDILQKESPEANIKAFDEVWVKQKGLPTISTTRLLDGSIYLQQNDAYGRNLVWPQRITTGVIVDDKRQEQGFRVEPVSVEMADSDHVVLRPTTEKGPLQVLANAKLVVPNLDGMGYGRFTADDNMVLYLGYTCQTEQNDVRRLSAVMTLYENYTLKNLSAATLFSTLLTYLAYEENPLVAASVCGFLGRAMTDIGPHERAMAEYSLYNSATTNALPNVRQQLMRLLSTSAISNTIVDRIYETWQSQADTLLNERDYMRMAYHLAIMRPAEWQQILNIQRERLTTDDLKREFDYIARACTPDLLEQDNLFLALLKPENRRVEPWARTLFSLLNHPTREPYSNHYIVPALDALPDIQRTSDIFFPGDWLSALLNGHRSDAARQLVSEWIELHSELSPTLMNKLKERAYWLLTR